MSDELVLRLVGLGHRAGRVAVGVEAARAALVRGAATCVVLARDASPRAREKVARAARARGVPVVVGPPAALLGARLGRPAVHAVVVRDRNIGRGLLGRDTRPEGTEDP